MANITVITVGYTNYAFDNLGDALDVYRALSRSVRLETHSGDLPDGRKGIDLILSPSSNDLTLKAYDQRVIEGNHTLAELKQMVKDREDLEQSMKVVPTLEILEAPGTAYD